jgi:cyclopropane-fatty-acyl-phospholipid synthase
MSVLSPPPHAERNRPGRTALNPPALSSEVGAASPSHALGSVSRWCRGALVGSFARLEQGRLALVEGPARNEFGGRAVDSAALAAEVCVRAPQFNRRIVLGGTLGAAASYLDEEWDCDDLTALFRILLRNEAAMARLDGPAARLAGYAARVGHALRRNSRRGSRRNIAAHYDLGNDFFALFLDPTMTYSCGYFASPETTLEEASAAKYERLCRRLELQPTDHLLEIGTGWGGLALHAAQRFGCRVTTTTISAEQRRCALERVAAAGLQDRITVLHQDYRDLQGQYDKLISIEMIEAVGHAYLPQYFATCFRLLKPGGRFALQAITMPDARYDAYRRQVDFIQQYVFPGGMLPSLGAMVDAASRRSRFEWLHVEDLALHYARTLACWRERFEENLAAIRELGTPERLVRTWRYYFAYCEAAFLERAIGLAQIVLRRPDSY